MGSGLSYPDLLEHNQHYLVRDNAPFILHGQEPAIYICRAEWIDRGRWGMWELIPLDPDVAAQSSYIMWNDVVFLVEIGASGLTMIMVGVLQEMRKIDVEAAKSSTFKELMEWMS